MPYSTSIPAPPGEDYDLQHTLLISLSSLECLISSFDAVMDSLEQTTTKLEQKLDALEIKSAKIKKNLLQNKSNIKCTFSPESYPSTNRNTNFIILPSKNCRDKSNEAIQKCLISEKKAFCEKTKFDIELSDTWLDRGDTFEEEILTKMTTSLSVNAFLDENSNLTSIQDSNNEEDNNDDGIGIVTNHQSRIQHGLFGSPPFTCELLHDSFGCRNATGICDDSGILPRINTVEMIKHNLIEHDNE